MKAYQDHVPPSRELTAQRRQDDAAFAYTMIAEDIEDGFLDAAAGWQCNIAVFYARARYTMGIREEDYNA
ncbi:hypothetical protein EVC02_071 [Rhizobium phage RHph_N17]|nr:hypothetical protein EVC02_071 [Rhizobium phage RHph_N17]